MAYKLDIHRNRIAMRSDLTLFLTHLTRARKISDLDRILGDERPDATALEVLFEILKSQKLLGSGREGKIIGPRKAVCFQDTPLYCLGQMYFQEESVKLAAKEKADAKNKAVARVLEQMKGFGFVAPTGANLVDKLIQKGDVTVTQSEYRYELFGISFMKTYLYQAFARPVVYENTKWAGNRDGKGRLLPDDEVWRLVDLDLSHNDSLVDWTHEREWRLPVEESFEFEMEQAVIILPNATAYKQFVDYVQDNKLDWLSRVAGIVTMQPVFF